MNSNTDSLFPTSTPVYGDAAERLTNRDDDAFRSGERVVATTAQSVRSGLDEPSERVPAPVSRVAAQAEDLTRRAIERARQRGGLARDRASQVSDATVERIRADPVKAVMLAAAAGAVTAWLVQWLSRSRRDA
jgi:ElaB/YqjD/DUF883 family membrane-anchored ribosome-binding protein